MSYLIHADQSRVVIGADFGGLSRRGLTQIVLMTECGATAFCAYRDSSGLALEGAEVGAWEEVDAELAGFCDPTSGAFFEVERRDRARLFRGRESVAGRLSWSGFGYVLPPSAKAFEYAVRIGEGA